MADDAHDPIPPLPEYTDNPFIEALGPIRKLKEVQASLDRPPLLMEYDRRRPPEERMHTALRLLRYSQPTVVGRTVGMQIDQMIRQGYIGRNPLTSDWYRKAAACSERESEIERVSRNARLSGRPTLSPEAVFTEMTSENDTSLSCLMVGPPGTGKTHMVKLALAHYPQVIVHDAPVEDTLAPLVVTQITWLRVECPPDGSLKGMCSFFFAAVDKALRGAGIASNLEKEYRSQTIPVQLVGMARVANLHAIGILVIDEIQHAKISRGEGHSLLNVLVALRNTIGISLIMIGTMSALPILQRTFRDARRADGMGSILFSRMPPADSMKSLTPASAEHAGTGNGDGIDGPVAIYGEEFEGFVRRMWRWQYTAADTELSVELLNAFYEETQGVTDLIIKLFALCQMSLMTIAAARPNFDERITPELVREVASKSFNTVRKFIKALRENDEKALREYEDLLDYGNWFEAQISGMGVPERSPMFDEDHGASKFPPMVVEGSIDRGVVDQVLKGMDVKDSRREDFIVRNRELIERGDLSGLVAAAQVLVQNEAELAIRPQSRKEVPPTDPNDLRLRLSGVSEAGAVAGALDAPDLHEALEG